MEECGAVRGGEGEAEEREERKVSAAVDGR